MKLEVRLFANLRDLLPNDAKGVTQVEMAQGSTAAELITKMKIPRDLPLIVMINGKREDETTELKEDDRIGIFPPVGGG